ncbi:MAG: hypothetical protein ACI4O7_04025 [Aristaeellaceae bacterium]
MGNGSYRASDWSRLRASRKMDTTANESEIFTRRSVDPRFDPRYINYREARDSQEHPCSTPIILGLDVTASMGYLANKIAREALNETMLKLYSTRLIDDPQLLFAAYGDFNDRAPLQVTQFESDIRIAEQLMDLWLESGGQSQVVPELLWHFAAVHTRLDCCEKRHQKGFLITIGDSAELRPLNDSLCRRVFGPEERVPSAEDCLKAAQEKFEIMHIFIIGEANTCPPVFSGLLPGRTMVIHRSDIDALPEILISAMQLVTGKDRSAVVSQWSDMAQPIVRRAIANLTVGNSRKGFFF